MNVGTTCCRAYQAYFPSGAWWIHSKFCPLKPGEKIRKVGEHAEPDAPKAPVRPIPVESPSADADAWAEYWGIH